MLLIHVRQILLWDDISDDILSHNGIWWMRQNILWKVANTWHCVPQSCSLAPISIILFVTHHDDFHMGAELELYIQLLLAFHDFFEGVSLTMHTFLCLTLFLDSF